MTWAQRKAQTSLKPVPLVGTGHVADVLRVSQSTVKRWCERGWLPGAFQTPGGPKRLGDWRIPRSTLDDLLAGRLDPERGTP